MSDSPEARLLALGHSLPELAPPAANYLPAVAVGGLLFLSGQLPLGPAGIAYAGKLGADLDIDAGRRAAALCAINLLAHAKAALGPLENVARVVKLTGFVNGTADFTEPHKVIDGASELMVAAFGETGRHARAAVVVASLPLNAAVEVEAIFAIAEGARHSKGTPATLP